MKKYTGFNIIINQAVRPGQVLTVTPEQMAQAMKSAGIHPLYAEHALRQLAINALTEAGDNGPRTFDELAIDLGIEYDDEIPHNSGFFVPGCDNALDAVDAIIRTLTAARAKQQAAEQTVVQLQAKLNQAQRENAELQDQVRTAHGIAMDRSNDARNYQRLAEDKAAQAAEATRQLAQANHHVAVAKHDASSRYEGMMNWKRTAEAKDAEIIKLRADLAEMTERWEQASSRQD